MSPGKRKILTVFLIATLQLVILQAAPADNAPADGAPPADKPPADKPPADTPSADKPPADTPSADKPPADTPSADKPPADTPSADTPATSASATEGTSGSQVSVHIPSPVKPSKPTGSKPTGGNPTTAVNGAIKPSSGGKPLGSCWSCLLQTVEEICSYFTDWTTPKKIPALNLLSIFHERSSEESGEDSVGMQGIASLFRFKRSVQDPAMAQEAFLELLDGFYVKARERFASENPGLVLTGLDNLYSRPEELAQVVAYVLGIPKEKLVQVFQNMKTRRTGEMLLQALSNRHNAIRGENKFENKSMGGLTPTSISYFFKELLGSVNGVATGLSEIISVVLQNQNTNVQPNKVE